MGYSLLGRLATHIGNDLRSCAVAREVVLVASVATEATWRKLANRVLLAVVGARRHDLEEICVREAVILLPLGLVELRELVSDFLRWNG